MLIRPDQFSKVVKDKASQLVARRYVGYDNIERIEIERSEEMFVVRAIVNVLDKRFPVRLMIAQGSVMHSHCDCSLSTSNSACAHIGAVILKILELDPIRFPYLYENEKGKSTPSTSSIQERLLLQKKKLKIEQGMAYLDQQRKHYMASIMRYASINKIELVPFMRPENPSQITYKIGYDKKYVIRSLQDFLFQVEQKRFASFGKDFEAVMEYNDFDESAQKHLQFLRYMRLQASPSAHFSVNGMLHGNYVDCSSHLDELFDTCYDFKKGITESTGNFICEESYYRIKIHAEKKDDHIEITCESLKPFIMGNKHLYQILDQENGYILKRIVCDESGRVLSLLSKLFDEGLLIPETYYPAFFKYVLSEIIEYIDYDGEIIDLQEYDHVKLIGDMDEFERVIFKVECYNHAYDKKIGLDMNTEMKSYVQEIVEQSLMQYASRIDDHQAIFDPDHENTLTFIREVLPTLTDICDVFVSESIKKLGRNTKFNITVGVRISNDLLSIDINSDQIPKKELSSVLKAYRKKKKFYRLKNGEVLSLDSQTLEELNQFLDTYHLQQDISNEITMNSYRAFSLDQSSRSFLHLKVDRRDSFVTFIRQFDTNRQIETVIPDGYEDVLRDYQKKGFEWMSLMHRVGFNGILADDMGLGKTVQVIALLESIQKEGISSLVVCPSSLVYNWESEIKKFSNKLKSVCIVGNVSNRKALLEEKADIYITSYDYCRRDVDLYDEKSFEYVILDEAQYIKNQKTRNARAVKELNGKHKLALTGTPIENSLAELWSIFDFLMPNYLFNYHYFQTHYENDIVKNHDEEKQKALKKLVEPFILRRRKQDVLKELPEKSETTLVIDFSEEEKELYYANLASANDELKEYTRSGQMDKLHVLALLTRLRQLCCEPRLVYDNVEESSSKLKACLSLIESLKASNQKVLLFSSFTSMLDLIAQELDKAHISYYMLTGRTSKEERRQLVDNFQKDDTQVFLISLKAGGTGLNLTAASAVIHIDPWWNLSAQNQATDRAHRIGQVNPVGVYKLIMKGSIEEKIQTLQEMKKQLADTFVENNDGTISTLTSEELYSLFRI